MKIVKSTSTMTRCLLLGLVSWLAFVASASAQGIECVPAGWHTDVSHTPGPGPDSGVLSFGPPINAGFNRILSQVVVGDQIQLVITPYSICGIGIPLRLIKIIRGQIGMHFSFQLFLTACGHC